jgi:hypothetical protein
VSLVKKVVVTDYQSNGEMTLKATLTLKKGVVANDYPQAKKLIAQVLQSHVLGKKNFSVEWKRDGFYEGYLVAR